MKKRSYVCLYLSYQEMFEAYSDREVGWMIRAMLKYAFEGEDSEAKGAVRYIWPTLRSQIDRDAVAYEKRCEANRKNGAKGGRPKKKTQEETEGAVP